MERHRNIDGFVPIRPEEQNPRRREELRHAVTLEIEQAEAGLRHMLSALESTPHSAHNRSDIDLAHSYLKLLGQFRHDLANPNGLEPLNSLSAGAKAAIISAQKFQAQVQSELSSGHLSEQAQRDPQATLQQASARARRAVLAASDDLFGRRIFDPYLRFASAEDEAAYRKREAERKAEIDRSMAERTPQGALRATDTALAQVEDAGAHGAERSPDFARLKHRLETQKAQLGAAISRDAAASAEKPLPEVSPDLIAALRTAGVVTADQTQDGHGLAVNQRPQDSGRSPA